MVFDRCPGTASVARPKLLLIPCTKCGSEVEIFSDEERTACDKCGTVVFKERDPSCFDWCKYAEECLEELKKPG